jgi:hypothetical protein
MEIYISPSSIKEEDKGVQIKKEEKSINLGKAQIFMKVSNTENSLMGIKILILILLSEAFIQKQNSTNHQFENIDNTSPSDLSLNTAKGE